MKKWLYIISVGSLTAIFSVFYVSDRRAADKRAAEHAVTAQKLKDEADAKRKADELKAQQDAQQREQARRDEEKAKEVERRRKWDEESKKIQDDTNAALAKADKAAKDSARLEIDLDNVHKASEKVNRETFEMAKRVERANQERQAAEQEIQRTIEFIARHAAESSMTKMPAPPPVMAAPAK